MKKMFVSNFCKIELATYGIIFRPIFLLLNIPVASYQFDRAMTQDYKIIELNIFSKQHQFHLQ